MAQGTCIKPQEPRELGDFAGKSQERSPRQWSTTCRPDSKSLCSAHPDSAMELKKTDHISRPEGLV